MNLILIAFLFTIICYVTCDPPSYCLPIQPIPHSDVAAPPPAPMTLQGHPGKIGPVGPPGPPGISGVCDCDLNEIEQLRIEIRRINGLYFLFCFFVLGLFFWFSLSFK